MPCAISDGSRIRGLHRLSFETSERSVSPTPKVFSCRSPDFVARITPQNLDLQLLPLSRYIVYKSLQRLSLGMLPKCFDLGCN